MTIQEQLQEVDRHLQNLAESKDLNSIWQAIDLLRQAVEELNKKVEGK